MRFMMLMIPKGYEKAEPGAVPPADRVAAMMKYNVDLQKAGVAFARRSTPAVDGRASFFQRREVERDRRPLCRNERDSRRLLDDSSEIEGRSDPMGVALPRL